MRQSSPEECYICRVRTLTTVILALMLTGKATAQKSVAFPTEDSGVIYADVYGAGERGIVLAHGGRFNKESWKSQARILATAKFRVLALDFRGYGRSRGPGQSEPMSAQLHLDVLAAVRYLRKTGAKSVSIVGGSMGGGRPAMRRSSRGRVRSIASYSSALRRTNLRINSSHPLSSSSHATMQARTDHVSPGFKSNTRKLPNQKS